MSKNKENNILNIFLSVVAVLSITLIGVFLLKADNESEFLKTVQDTETTYIPSEDSPTSMLIDINTAPKEELMLLDNIGEKRAEAIIEYRKDKPFETIEDIYNIEGIGNAIFSEIKDKICVK